METAKRNKNNNYPKIAINGVQYLAHRLAFVYMTGRWPTKYVDHINRDRGDGRWTNLRQADFTQHRANSVAFHNNRLGVKGITFNKNAKKKPFRACISAKRKHYYLGDFSTLEEASAAYEHAAKRLFGDYARAR